MSLASLSNAWGRRWGETHVKLPPLDVLACVLVGNDDDELGDLAANHPLVELGHDLLDVGLDLIVGRHWRWGGASISWLRRFRGLR
jgi:hypothetical protein